MTKQQNKIMNQRKNTRNAQRHICLHTEDPIKKKPKLETITYMQRTCKVKNNALT